VSRQAIPFEPPFNLGLVVNALILWTTRYVDAALNHLRATGPRWGKKTSPTLTPQLQAL